MSFLIGALLMLLAGILIPFGIVLGLFVGFRLLLWWLDRALQVEGDDNPSSK